MWKTGLLLVNEFHEEDIDSNVKRVDYLSTLMLQFPEAVRTTRPARLCFAAERLVF